MTAVWLDRLPEPFLIKLAHTLQLGNTCITADVVSLAESTPSLQRAVLAATDYILNTSDPELLPRAAALFSNTIRALRTFSDASHPAFHPLLSASTLRAASITDNEPSVAALLQAPRVQRLDLTICRDATSPRLAALLRALPLTHLTVECYVSSPLKNTLLHASLSDPLSDDSIPALCPRLEALRVTCCKDTRGAIFWRLFPHLPALTHVRLDSAPRRDALHRLRHLESVELLQGVKDAVYHAENLGACVTRFSSFDMLEDVDFGVLQGCPRLAVLEACPTVAQEEKLLALVGALPGLRKLGLTFDRHQRFSGKRRRGGLFDSMSAGMLERTVKSAALLEDLDLSGLCVQQNEMCAILKHMGRRLKRIDVCLKGQPEPMFDRLEMMMDLLGKYNPNVSSFEALEFWSASSIRHNLRRKGKDLAKRRKQQRAQGKRLLKKLHIVRKRSHWGAWKDMEQLVEILL